MKTAQDYGTPLRILETVVAVNDKRKHDMADKIISACDGDVSGKTIAVLGLTFKPNTDDMRDAQSLAIIPALQKAGASVRAYNPEGMHEAKKLLPTDITYCADGYDTMTGADAVVLLTEWNQFRNLDTTRIKSLLKAPVMWICGMSIHQLT